jgi:exopolysaccharide production protein ExoZ
MAQHPAGAATGRNLPVDGLRGLLALLVLVYHCMGWLGLSLPAWLKATGLMGVDGFFVISGYALARVYRNAAWHEPKVVLDYVWKRVMRIAPLLFFATALALAPRRLIPVLAGFALIWLALRHRRGARALAQGALLAGVLLHLALTKPDPSMLPTLSLLWAFVDPTLSLPVGSWSIGVELVFYFALPLVFVVTRGSRWMLLSVLGLSVIAAIAFQAFHATALQPGAPAQNWRNYVAVPHHAYFFIAGMALCAWQEMGKASPRVWAGLTIGLAALYVASASYGAPDHGWLRAWSAALTIGIVAGVTMLESVRLPAGFSMGLVALGEVSYGVYMLHPPVFQWVHERVLRDAGSPGLEVAVTLVATVAMAALTRTTFERTFEGLRRARRAQPAPSLAGRAQ